MTLIYLSGAWLAGIYLGSKIALPLGAILLGFLPLCLIPFLSQYRKLLLLSGFCLLAFLGGSLRLQSSLPTANEHHLQFYNDRGVVELEGTVATDPEARDAVSIFQISVSELQIDGQRKEISGTFSSRRVSGFGIMDIISKVSASQMEPEPAIVTIFPEIILIQVDFSAC